MAATISEKVTAHKGTNSIGTMFIHETFTEGAIVKVNGNSIRVRLENERRTVNGKNQSERTMNTLATFTFWKTRSDNGKALYKSAEYGIITV
jgi:hypothetical protein